MRLPYKGMSKELLTLLQMENHRLTQQNVMLANTVRMTALHADGTESNELSLRHELSQMQDYLSTSHLKEILKPDEIEMIIQCCKEMAESGRNPIQKYTCASQTHAILTNRVVLYAHYHNYPKYLAEACHIYHVMFQYISLII